MTYGNPGSLEPLPPPPGSPVPTNPKPAPKNEDDSPPPEAPRPPEDPPMSEAEALVLVDSIRATFPWLDDIPGIFDIIMDGVTTDLPAEVILANVRASEAYAERFPGMAERKTGGYNPINEAEYLSLEDSYRTLFSNYGVLGLFDTGTNSLSAMFGELIGGDVSPTELSARLDEGYAAMADASADVRAAFLEFYGVELDDSTLLAYFLDEDLGLSEMENVVAASTVGGAALKYGLNITRTRAELLAGEGITGHMANSGFANVARETPQLQKLANLHGYNPLSQEDLEGFFFHEDPEVAAQRRKIFDTALSDFRGAGASSVTREGTLSELVDLDQSI